MNDLRQAAEQALEALRYTTDHLPAKTGVERYVDEAITALQVALAQPVDAVNMSQERVDETAKGEHEWKGLDGEIPGLGLVTEEFYNGMIVAEDILRKRNT
jgi:hypothetical protein